MREETRRMAEAVEIVRTGGAPAWTSALDVIGAEIQQQLCDAAEYTDGGQALAIATELLGCLDTVRRRPVPSYCSDSELFDWMVAISFF